MAPRKKTPTVAFTNLNKVFFPKSGFSKGDLIKYYIDVAPTLIPHFRQRPVTLIRMPNGVAGETFYEKNAPGFTPDWVQTTPVPRSEGGVINYLMLNDAPTLAWCANNGVVELHPFLHRAENLQRPTHVAFDLDPGEGADILTCIEVAHLIREVLTGLKLQVFPKVSGSKGLQLYVPLNTKVTYGAATPFAKAVADLLHQQHPGLIVSDMSKALRVNRVFIDWSQNNEKKTTVGPYSVRGKRLEPFVSLPVTWDELKAAEKSGKADRLYFSPGDALKRIAQRGDVFAPVLKLKQMLPREFGAGARVTDELKAPSSLRRYAEKRDFSRTAEPAPMVPQRSRQGSRRRFVIQKHAASHLHYDFRLEMDDVLKSWAVPKGLSTEVGVKRSAFQTEDHPLDYYSFEGTIPQGQYGGGTVMVWDIGTYDVLGGNHAKGDLKLWLEGKKLKGEWHIFRIKSDDEKPVWLVNKAREEARKITAQQEDTSVLSGRTLEQIAAAKDAVWQSKGPPEAAGNDLPAKSKKAETVGAPTFIKPMEARAVKVLPDDRDWIYEIAWDGHRALGMKHGDHVELRSPENKSMDAHWPGMREALRMINADTAMIDGEVVALDATGKPHPQDPRNRRPDAATIVFYAFDLLALNGEDWRHRPLEERKAKLGEIIANSALKLSRSFEGPAPRIVAEVEKLGLHGVMGKRRDSTYESGERTGAWVQLRLDAKLRGKIKPRSKSRSLTTAKAARAPARSTARTVHQRSARRRAASG